MKPIFLIGFMGTGKSITGKKLALALGRVFIDLDARIEQETNRIIADIFAQEGEMEFRNIESAVLKNCLVEDSIISCGGGTPCYNDNMEFINANGHSIYLKTNRGILVSRLIQNKSKRPLLADKSDTELIVFINNLLDCREPFYEQATFSFQMDKKKMDDLIVLVKNLS